MTKPRTFWLRTPAKKLGKVKQSALALPFLVLTWVLCWPTTTLAARVHVLFSSTSPSDGPFPSNLFTVSDPSQNTQLRINLPFPDCSTRPSDCEDTAILNTLDGFNAQPRLSLPFSGHIDVSTVTSETVFLLRLGSTLPDSAGAPGGKRIGINQIVWDVTTKTLAVESDEVLDQHTRYALIVTSEVRDSQGKRVSGLGLAKFLLQLSQTPNLRAYQRMMLEALVAAARAKVPLQDIVALSVFTTRSVTAILEKMRDQIKANTPEPADFLLGPSGARTVFSVSNVANVIYNYQFGANPTNPASFTAFPLFLQGLQLVPDAVGQIAYGKYLSPDYETPQKFIPPVGTLTGTPAVQRLNEVFFNLFLPSGPKPPNGWPVAIYGHGSGGGKDNDPFITAASVAAQGVATIAINGVGNGGGAAGALTVIPVSGDLVTFPAGGRGVDLDGDGTIFPFEGRNSAPPRTILGWSDGMRQIVADWMQLVRIIEVGVDIDGDHSPDLDASRISYYGGSFGGFLGPMLLAVEPHVHAGAFNVPGSTITNSFQLSPESRSLFLIPYLGLFRTPSLLNVNGVDFNENLPLRNQPPVINTVPGAIALQKFFDTSEWIQIAGDALGYALYLRKQLLKGVSVKEVLIQFARGDQNVANPSTTALLRAGDLADRATFYRHDLAFADPLHNPTGNEVPKNPHSLFFFSPFFFPALADFAANTRQQVAEFLASDGTSIIDPDGPGPLFEVPIVPPLPEDLGFIP